MFAGEGESVAGKLNKILVAVSSEEKLNQIPARESFSAEKQQSIPLAVGWEDEVAIKAAC